MTATVTAPSGTGTDLRHASRMLAAVLLPIGPASIAVLRFVLPYYTADDASTIVREVAEHQTAESAVVWLGFVAVLTMVPAAWFAGRVVGRSAPRLAAIATPLMLAGYLTLGWLNVEDAAVLYGVRHGVGHTTLAGMYDSMHPVAAVATVLFVLGHVLGTILLGVGMLRGRVVAPLFAWATIVSQPIHFVAAIVVPSHALDLVGWGLTAVGFAALSVAILRLADDEWAPAPRA
jgi:hypothetical protein